MADEAGAFFDSAEFEGNLESLSAKLGVGVEEAMEEWGPVLVDYAQANAPWADRTGEARAGLDYDVYEEGGEVVLDLMHTADHGYWLELIQGGRFAIIMPTLEAHAGAIFESVGGEGTGW